MTTHDPYSAAAWYLTLVQRQPRLDREQESLLVRRWQEHADSEARDALIRAQLRGVTAIAQRYSRYGLPLEELIAEGNLGLMHALTKFEPVHGVRLATYAGYWIRAYVLNHAVRCFSLVGFGSGALRSKVFFKLRREHARALSRVGDGEQACRLLAQELALPEEKLRGMLRQVEARDASLDAPVANDTGTKLRDLLPALDGDQEQAVARRQTCAEVRAVVHAALAELDQRERYIVEQRLMVDAEDELTLAEIGARLGVSRERARQLEARAKRKLRVRFMRLQGADLGYAA
jgi:RNA polymerase sigma-32 factor